MVEYIKKIIKHEFLSCNTFILFIFRAGLSSNNPLLGRGDHETGREIRQVKDAYRFVVWLRSGNTRGHRRTVERQSSSDDSLKSNDCTSNQLGGQILFFGTQFCEVGGDVTDDDAAAFSSSLPSRRLCLLVVSGTHGHQAADALQRLLDVGLDAYYTHSVTREVAQTLVWLLTWKLKQKSSFANYWS